MHVALRIVNGQQHFVQAAAGTGLDLSSTSGFYRFSDNQAVVRWLGDAGTAPSPAMRSPTWRSATGWVRYRCG